MMCNADDVLQRIVSAGNKASSLSAQSNTAATWFAQEAQKDISVVNASILETLIHSYTSVAVSVKQLPDDFSVQQRIEASCKVRP